MFLPLITEQSVDEMLLCLNDFGVFTRQLWDGSIWNGFACERSHMQTHYNIIAVTSRSATGIIDTGTMACTKRSEEVDEQLTRTCV